MVGYLSDQQERLPELKQGILNMAFRSGKGSSTTELDAHALDSYYAQTYSWYLDLEILIKGWRYLS